MVKTSVYELLKAICHLQRTSLVSTYITLAVALPLYASGAANLAQQPNAVPTLSTPAEATVERMLNGGKWFRREQTQPDAAPAVRIDSNVINTGGTVGFVVPALRINCSVPSLKLPLNDFVWCNSTVMSSSARGSGQHVAVTGTVVRPADALADGLGPRSETWAAYFENNDQSNASAKVSGSVVGIENDIYANDDDPEGQRIVLQLMIGRSNPRGAPAKIGSGITIGRNDTVSFYGTPVRITAPFDVAGVDLSRSQSINSAPALRLAAGQSIDLSGDSRHLLTFGEKQESLRYVVSGRNKLEVNDRGDLIVKGDLAAANASVAGLLRRGAEATNSISEANVGGEFNVGVACQTDVEVLNPVNSQSIGALTLCRTPTNGQYISILATDCIRKLSFNVAVTGAPGSLSPSSPVRLIWVSGSRTWMRAP